LNERNLAISLLTVLLIVGTIAAYQQVLLLNLTNVKSTTSSPTTRTVISTSTLTQNVTLVLISTTTKFLTTSANSSAQNQAAVVAQIALLQKYYDELDVTDISSFYTSTSVVHLFGYTNGLGGVYNGTHNIQLLYGAVLGTDTSLNINFNNLQTKVDTASAVNATSSVILKGVSKVEGSMNITANVSQEWVLSGSTWMIQKEDWNFTLFNVANPGEGGTVFPQWGLSLSGQNPKLADMHVIEWNYAPYAAAAIYVSLAAIATVALWVRRSRRA
jgi:hypothetical protein